MRPTPLHLESGFFYEGIVSVFGLPPEVPDGEAHAKWWWFAHNVASGAHTHAMPAWAGRLPPTRRAGWAAGGGAASGPACKLPALATDPEPSHTPCIHPPAEHVANVRGGHPWIHQIGAPDAVQYQNPWFMRWEDAVVQWRVEKKA